MSVNNENAPRGDCSDWEYSYYVVTRSDKFVFGFSLFHEAVAYSRECNKAGQRTRVIPRSEAMKLPGPPQFLRSWSEAYKEVAGLTD